VPPTRWTSPEAPTRLSNDSHQATGIPPVIPAAWPVRLIFHVSSSEKDNRAGRPQRGAHHEINEQSSHSARRAERLRLNGHTPRTYQTCFMAPDRSPYSTPISDTGVPGDSAWSGTSRKLASPMARMAGGRASRLGGRPALENNQHGRTYETNTRLSARADPSGGYPAQRSTPPKQQSARSDSVASLSGPTGHLPEFGWSRSHRNTRPKEKRIVCKQQEHQPAARERVITTMRLASCVVRIANSAATPTIAHLRRMLRRVFADNRGSGKKKQPQTKPSTAKRRNTPTANPCHAAKQAQKTNSG